MHIIVYRFGYDRAFSIHTIITQMDFVFLYRFYLDQFASNQIDF